MLVYFDKNTVAIMLKYNTIYTEHRDNNRRADEKFLLSSWLTFFS